MSKSVLILTLAAASVLVSACGGSQKDERIEAAVSEAQRANAETDALKIRVENLENCLEHDEGMYADGYPVQPTPGASSTATPSSSPVPAAAKAASKHEKAGAEKAGSEKAGGEKAGRAHGGGHERSGREKKQH